MTNLTAGTVTTATDALGITTITFFHPAHNSLPSRVLTDLAAAIRQAGQNQQTRVIILKSEGEKTFCAGASFDELQVIETEAQSLAFFSGFAKVINACRTSAKIIIGRAQGKAVGGGVGVAAATDYCLASTQAAIKLSELAVGIGPFVVGPVVERKIGRAAYQQLALDATEFRSAAWAHDKGLYAALFEDQESLDAAVQAFAVQLATYAPDALAAMKKVFWEGTEHWETLLPERAAISGTLVLSEFTRSVIQKLKGGS